MKKKIAADRNYRMVKRAFRDPTLMTITTALQDAGWSQIWPKSGGNYFTKGEESEGNVYEVKIVVTKQPEKNQSD